MIFREITLEAASPPQMLAFYGRTLGFDVVSEREEEVAVRAGATTLTFRVGARPPASYHFALRIPASTFDAAKQWLGARTDLVGDGERDEFDWDFWGARAVYAYDAGGNIIEFIAFPALDPADAHESTFGPEAVVGVAELGLAVADPADAVGRLTRTFAIGLWDREEVTADALTPVGEQGATFLVSPIGRNWLFGGPATDAPIDVVLGGVRAGVLEFETHPYRVVGIA